MKCGKIWIIIGVLIFIAGAAWCGIKKDDSDKETVDTLSWENACNTPYGKYPELVTYTLGQMIGENNSNLPEGNTYEDNAYTRYLKDMLNIQNKNIYMESDSKYSMLIDVAIKDGTLPDVMVVDDREKLEVLVKNDQIEDLTECFEKCATDKIKEMYDSYGKELLDSVTFDGKIMAIPETVIDHGPCLLWLRKDWIEELGLKEPRSWADAVSIIQAFKDNRMGTEEGETPVGLVCAAELVGTTSSNYSVEPIFDLCNATPQRWQKDLEGNVIYGSTTEETKNALEYLQQLYKTGIIDQDFLLREQNNLKELVVEGKCGAFFGLWWSPNNPLMDAYENDRKMEWEPYYFPELAKSCNTYTTFRDNKYVVVRKGYEHPEIVIKILNVLFDYTRYEAKDAQELNSYFGLNVDIKARPLVINVDYIDATYKLTENIRKALAGEMQKEELSVIEASYFDACERYVNNEAESLSVEDIAAYKSRVSAVGLLVDSDYEIEQPQYLPGVVEIPQSLKNFEKNTFIQIIIGKKSINYFDTFVEEWYQKGGREITQKMQQK